MALCPHCRVPMKASSSGGGSCLSGLLGLITVLAGVAFILLFFWTCIMPVIGVLLIIVGVIIPFRGKRDWFCGSCGMRFPR